MRLSKWIGLGATVINVSATMIVMLWLGLLTVSPRLRLIEAEPAAGAAGLPGAVAVAVPDAAVGDGGVGAAGAAAAGLLPRKKATDTIASALSTASLDKTFDNDSSSRSRGVVSTVG